MMLTYRLLDSTLSIILPSDMHADIDEIEKMSFLTALTITPNKKTAPSVFFSFPGSAYLVSLEMPFWFIIKT